MKYDAKIRALYTVACFMAGAGTISDKRIQQLIINTYGPIRSLIYDKGIL